MDAEYFFNAGVLKSQSNDFKGAIEDYSKAIALSISIEKKTLTELKGDGSKESIPIIESNEGNINVYFNRGCAYIAVGKYESAVSDFNKILEYSSKDAEVFFKRAIAYYCLEKDDLVKLDIDSAKKLNSRYNEELFYSQFQ